MPHASEDLGDRSQEALNRFLYNLSPYSLSPITYFLKYRRGSTDCYCRDSTSYHPLSSAPFGAFSGLAFLAAVLRRLASSAGKTLRSISSILPPARSTAALAPG